MERRNGFLLYVLLFLLSLAVSGCNGSARELSKGSSLGPPVVGDDGSRSDGSDFGQIYSVTQIVSATSDIPEWVDADLPFNRPRIQMGVSATDSQWPFKFSFSYPPNNYKLNDVRIQIVTSRDSSDTEGIFVDGVFTGRVPGNMISTTSTKSTYRNYFCSGACNVAATGSANTYFMDWALTHYKQATMNTFDLDVTNLLTSTPLKPVDIVNDGVVRVVTGDDSRVDNALLFLEGFTISKTPLTCTNSASYDFKNVYIHNDGNSIGQSFFSGSVLTPSASWGAAQTEFRSVEFYYDPKLPKTSAAADIILTKANLTMNLKRMAGDSAIVINGIGISDPSFDRSSAGSEVESWNDSTSTTSYWSSFLSTIPNNSTSQTVTLNLINLLGAEAVRTLLLQGKLNVSVAGALATVYGQGATSGRTYGVAVNGPELSLEGNYSTKICEVPNNPSSPLNDSSGTVGSCEFDTASPVASSIQVVNITSSAATIQWLTSESADGQIAYGLTGTTSNSSLVTDLSNFHSITITGLQAYKYYQYAIKTKDGCGNQTITATKSFRTLR